MTLIWAERCHFQITLINCFNKSTSTCSILTLILFTGRAALEVRVWFCSTRQRGTLIVGQDHSSPSWDTTSAYVNMREKKLLESLATSQLKWRSVIKNCYIFYEFCVTFILLTILIVDFNHALSFIDLRKMAKMAPLLDYCWRKLYGTFN